VKAGWKTSLLGEKCEVIAGQSPEGKFYNTNANGLPFYQGKKEFGKKYIGKPNCWTSFTTKIALKDDILMSVRAPVGPINFSTQKICIGRGLAAIRPSRDIDKYFLFYYLLSIQNEISGNEGAVFPSINKNQIEGIKLSFPSLPEQKRIVAILDKAFAGIDKAIANTEKNLANARELFQGYLEKVFALNQGSHQVTLLEIATHITDGDHMPPPKASEGIPFITISNINKHTREIDFSDTFKVPEVYFRNLKISRKPKNGDILYTVTGSYGIPVRVPVGVRFCFQRHIGLIRPKVGVNSTWLYYALLSPSVLKQATDGATGTAQKTVSLKVLRGIRLPNVSQAEQVLIAQKSDTLWGRVQRLESIYQQKLKALSEVKQSFLQKAFSGELTSDTVQ
jgi:type I restriction enzyme S subunit